MILSGSVAAGLVVLLNKSERNIWREGDGEMTEIVTRHKDAVRPVSPCNGMRGCDCVIQPVVQLCFSFDF